MRCCPKPGWRPASRGVLDLFAGSKWWAAQMTQAGAPWVLTYELKDRDDRGLSIPAVQHYILKLIKLGCCAACAGGPVCSSMSVAVTPPVRARAFPAGAPWMSERTAAKVELGNIFAEFAANVMSFCILFNQP